MTNRLRRFLIYLIILCLSGIAFALGQSLASVPAPGAPAGQTVCDSAALMPSSPSVVVNEEIITDSLFSEDIPSDTLPSRGGRFSRINRDESDIESTVTFSAADSLVFYGQNDARMYGNSTVEYMDFKLNAGEIMMDMDSSTVYARGMLDTLGAVVQNPIFKDKSGEYESGTMKYNFRTERGLITDLITEQGEGYLKAGITKKMDDGTFYIENGRYTTCSDHDHPHFYFQLTRGRVRPKKNIVTGPAYMVLADVPLPLAVPFGFFPFSKDYSSGIIFPSFGEDYNRGFYLRDGGYYFAINDYVDLALRGEIYTKGSWGLNGHSTYNKRYKFRGNVDISYIATITGDKGLPDYARQNNFRVAWTHQQDTKANPNMNFSAAVNFTTSGYTRNDLNSYYNNSFTENTKSSTVNLTYRFPRSKWSLSATANISQRTQDSTISVSFPNLTVTMTQHAPFKRKRPVGGERWYEKIRMSYSGQFTNSLTARQDVFLKKSLIRDWQNEFRHSLPISATFSVFKYINVTPQISINDRMYTQKYHRMWDTQASREVVDTTYGFYNVFDFNASVSMSTKIYGFFKPLPFLGKKVDMIRHVLTPTVSLSAAPDFGAPFWGYYDSYEKPDGNGGTITQTYSRFRYSPSRGKSGMVTYSFANNLEMKVKSDADSTGFKKISLIENLSFSQSYNFAADSLRFSNISTSIMLRLVKNFNLNLSATWDPYMYALSPSGNPVRVDRLRIGHGKGIARLSSTGTSFSYTFNNDTFRFNKGKKEDTGQNNVPEEDDDEGANFSGESFAEQAARRRGQQHSETAAESDADGYAPWSVPWSLTVNYSVNYGYGAFDKNKMEYAGKWTQNLSFSGTLRPTPNWNFSLSASYNFDLHKIVYMNCSLSRDLHCFTMTCSFVPVGPYKSYNFHIAVKSSLLRDLKYDKRSSARNGIIWY